MHDDLNETDPLADELGLDELLLIAGLPEGQWQLPIPRDDQRTLLRRLALSAAWDREPEAELVYKTRRDTLLVRFHGAPSAVARDWHEQLSIGFDVDGPDARLTTLCLIGMQTGVPAEVRQLAQRVLGPTVWAAAERLAGSGADQRLQVALTRDEGADLRHVWVATLANGESLLPASPQGGDAADAVTDAELEELIAEWTLQVFSGAHRGRDTDEVTTHFSAADGAEREIAALAQYGIHPRITWRIDSGAPNRLIIRAAALDLDNEIPTGVASAVAVQIAGQRTWSPFLGDEYGDLIAEVTLPANHGDDDLIIRIKYQPTGDE